MIIERLSISAPRGKRSEFGEALASFTGPVQVQRGCLSCSIFQSWLVQDVLQMETRWNSQEDLARHLQSDIYKKLLLLMELSATPPSLEFLRVIELRGLDLVEAVRHSSD